MKRLPLLFCLFLLGACNFFAPETTVQLLDAENQAFSTQIANDRATGTAVNDMLLATQQMAETAIRAVDQQSTRIASTLVSRGTLVVDASGLEPIPPTPLPMDAILSGSTGDNAASGSFNPQQITPMVTGDGAARGSIPVGPTPAFIPVTNATPTPLSILSDGTQPTNNAPVNPTAPNLTNVAFSSSVGADDCPVSPTTSFSSAATSIYVTAVGNNLTSNNVIASRWFLDGSEQVFYDWTPRGTVNGACIWFYITPEAVAFTPGTWSVELSIDGTVVNTSGFTIQ